MLAPPCWRGDRAVGFARIATFRNCTPFTTTIAKHRPVAKALVGGLWRTGIGEGSDKHVTVVADKQGRHHESEEQACDF
jgi:hypothetical protein